MMVMLHSSGGGSFPIEIPSSLLDEEGDGYSIGYVIDDYIEANFEGVVSYDFILEEEEYLYI